MIFRGTHARGESPLPRAEDAGSHGEAGGLAIGRLGRSSDHDAGKFGAGNPGEGGLVLVLSLHLEDVEEVCG